MDRLAFEYLYLHANSLATLGMLRGMARLVAMPAPTETTPEMREFVAGIEHDLAHPESFNWAAFDGMDEEVDDLIRKQEEAVAQGLPFFDHCVDMADPDEVDGDMPDVARYLARALAARETLAPRIDDSHAKVDHAALSAALAALPPALPPLTGPLSAAQFESWLEMYEAQHEGVHQVVAVTRKPEPFV